MAEAPGTEKWAFAICHILSKLSGPSDTVGPRPQTYRNTLIRQDIPGLSSDLPGGSHGPVLKMGLVLGCAGLGHPESAKLTFCCTIPLTYSVMEAAKVIAFLAKELLPKPSP